MKVIWIFLKLNMVCLVTYGSTIYFNTRLKLFRFDCHHLLSLAANMSITNYLSSSSFNFTFSLTKSLFCGLTGRVYLYHMLTRCVQSCNHSYLLATYHRSPTDTILLSAVGLAYVLQNTVSINNLTRAFKKNFLQK